MAYQPKVYRKDGGNTLVVDDGGSIQTLEDVGAVAGVTGLTAVEYGDGQAVHKTVITLSGVSITVTDGAPGFGSVQLYDFPAGAILTKGATLNLTLTAGSGGITDTFDGDVSLGTSGTLDGSLSDAEVNIIPSTGTTQAVGGVGTAKAQSTATELTVKDGTTTAINLFLNVLIDDADISAADTLSASGTVIICWENLGDY